MEGLATTVATTLIAHGYIVILAIMIVEEAGIPFIVPGDGLLLLAGYLASLGLLSFFGCLAVVVAGALIGSTVLYWLSRQGGRRLVLRYGHYLRLKEDRLDRLAALFGRLGPLAPGISRLIPGLRIYTSALAGLALVPYPIFLLNVLWAATVWALAFLWLGDLVGAHWRDYSQLSQEVTAYSVLGLALLVAAWWLVRRRRTHQRSEAPNQPPKVHDPDSRTGRGRRE